MLVTLGGRSFQAAVPQLWNALPSRLRDVTSVETFKINVKTFSFKKAFADRFTSVKLFICRYYHYEISLIISILISVVRFTIL